MVHFVNDLNPSLFHVLIDNVCFSFGIVERFAILYTLNIDSYLNSKGGKTSFSPLLFGRQKHTTLSHLSLSTRHRINVFFTFYYSTIQPIGTGCYCVVGIGLPTVLRRVRSLCTLHYKYSIKLLPHLYRSSCFAISRLSPIAVVYKSYVLLNIYYSYFNTNRTVFTSLLLPPIIASNSPGSHANSSLAL